MWDAVIIKPPTAIGCEDGGFGFISQRMQTGFVWANFRFASMFFLGEQAFQNA
jgi:hypothetical protein